MNEIAKENTKERLVKAIESEGLLNQDVAGIFDMHPSYMSWFKNPKYWEKIGDTFWERVLAWVNSGQTLKEYSEKRGKVLPEKKTQEPKEVITPVRKPDVKSPKTPVKLVREDRPRLSKGGMVDLLLEEKERLKLQIEAIDTLLKHYIS